MDTKPDYKVFHERLVAAEVQAVEQMGPPPASITESWTTITLPDGWGARTKVIKPVDTTSGPHPLVVLLYGGGFALGSPEQMTQPGRTIAEKLGAVVVCPDYKRVLEHKFPSGARSVWDILVYLSRHAARDFDATLAGPGGGFVLGGVSAGASLAAVAAAISLFGTDDDAEPLATPLTGVFASSPLLLTSDLVPDEYRPLWTSHDDNRNAEKFNTDTVVTRTLALLAPDFKSPWFSPFNLLAKHEGAGTAAGSNKPRFYIQVMQHDPLRDDGIVLEKELAKRGFETRITLFPDDGHTAWTVVAVPCKSKDPTIPEDTMAGMEWLLRQN